MLSPSILPTAMKEILTEERVPSEPAVAMAAAIEEGMHSKMCEIRDLSADRTAGTASSSREGPVILQWGHRKRPRCSRVDNHLKHSTLIEEPAVLLRKTVRVKAERVAPTEIIKAKNGMRERPRMPPPAAELHVGTQEGRKRAKIIRNGAPELFNVCSGDPTKEAKGSFFSCHVQNTHLPHTSKTRASPDRHTSSPYRSMIPTGGSIELEAAKIEIEWPKFFISLSRKEKEDDFLMIKGAKLPQRPKRRPKVVERALHFCTPGNWLTDLSRGRYDVREKKCVKKKPRGLKAMESMDSDSD